MVLDQRFSTTGDFTCSGTAGNVGRHFGCHNKVTGRGAGTGILWVEARCASKAQGSPTKHIQPEMPTVLRQRSPVRGVTKVRSRDQVHSTPESEPKHCTNFLINNNNYTMIPPGTLKVKCTVADRYGRYTLSRMHLREYFSLPW